MKKHIILLGTLLISGVAFSQVGIDTETPKATLDIKASPTNANKIDGLIAPRLTGNELKTNDGKYGADQTGAIVYATEAASPTTPKTIKVTQAGYYYFDGTIWQKFAFDSVASTADETIDAWIDDPANAMVKLGTKSDGTARSTGTDIVATDNGRIGIGTATPGMRLDIPNGQTRMGVASGFQVRQGPGYIDFYDNTGTLKGNVALNNTDGYLMLNSFANSGNTALNTLSGKVGIGITTPTEQLDIAREGVRIRNINTATYTGTDSDRLVVADGTGVLKTVARPAAGDTTNDAWINNGTAVILGTKANGSARDAATDFVALDNGRIGVGTATPETKFNLYTPGNNWGFQHDNGTVKIRTYAGPGASNNNEPAGWLYTVTNHPLILAAGSTGAAGTVFVTPSTGGTGGKVGIGTWSPDEKLHVVGGNIRVGASGTQQQIVVSDWFIDFLKVGGTTAQANIAYDGNNILRINGNGIEANANTIINQYAGRVGIGTANPTQKLEVNGNILASGTITPDYVFQKYFTGKSDLKADYKMMSLSEIEAFTKANHHLPGVPSAKDIENQGGIIVNRAAEINLEKIEELFLHTIEQQKQIDAQQKEINELKEQVKALLAK